MEKDDKELIENHDNEESIQCNKGKGVKLWNKNFFLLWQGQLVSVLGDVLYVIALNLWILEATGSTALMGLLSALTMLPRLVIGPFAGVLVDKWDRKKIIVITDFIRGVFVTFIGIAALLGFIQVWMVFIVGIVIGLCGAFFNPSISSVKPDIVHESKLVQANSVSSLAQSGMDMIGNAAGGILFVTIGAPYMFLFNGISYIFSAFTELFITVPKVERKTEELNFKEDFKEGLKFMWGFKTLRNIFFAASGINFFGNAGFILFLPYFKETSFLGPEKYGFAMAVVSASMVSGSILLSVFTIKRQNRFKVFRISIFLCGLLLICIPFVQNYIALLVVLFVGFFCNVTFNTLFNSTIMLVVPRDKRGKVGSLMNTMSMGLAPLGTVVGGVLGEFLELKIALAVLFIFSFVFIMICANVKGCKDLIEYSLEEEDVEVLIERTNSISS